MSELPVIKYLLILVHIIIITILDLQIGAISALGINNETYLKG